jgi:hypothetical protein
MIPVKLLQELGEEGKRMAEEMNSYRTHLIHCKNLCKSHHVPLHIIIVKEKK